MYIMPKCFIIYEFISLKYILTCFMKSYPHQNSLHIAFSVDPSFLVQQSYCLEKLRVIQLNLKKRTKNGTILFIIIYKLY